MRVAFEVEKSVAWVTLVNGDRGNPLDLDTVAELRTAIQQIKSMPGLTAIVLSSRGNNFCFGGNFKTMGVAPDLDRYIRRVTIEYHDWLLDFLRLPLPIFSAVQGGVAGAGVALALFADHVIARDDAHFTLAFAQLGATPDGGTSFLLPRLIGFRKFQELLISNRRVDAEEALAIGMVSEVCTQSSFSDRIKSVADQAQSLVPGAIAAARALLFESMSNTLESHLNLESRMLSERCATVEMKSALARAIAEIGPPKTLAT